MFFKQFLRDDLGCASYLIGDPDAGECMVVDPQWDVEDYIDAASRQGMKIRYVVESHNHAAHVSGSLCGKSMSPKPSSTIGYERRYNRPLLAPGKETFIEEVTRDLPPQPPHFASIVARNQGPFVTEQRVPRPMSADEVEAMR